MNNKDDDGNVDDINHEDVDNFDLGFHQVEEALSKSGGQHLDCWSSDIDLGVSKDIMMIICTLIWSNMHYAHLRVF